ncbi:SUF system NifU family Fe-S cluster assembly protein [Candidatus Roizmanbacteria bacterium]|nr:SUF system NifU family Fe-S cluster assembly protein [Candidatus Roizmanbacteria bacterium]
MSIYSELILDHYQHPRNFGIIVNPTLKSFVSNPLCGDEIEVAIKIEKGKVAEIKFQGRGCAISLAAASMLTEFLKGKPKEQLKKINKEHMIKMLGIELGVNRIKCALLPLEALKKL